MNGHAEGKTNVTVSAVIVRACSVCGGPRQVDADCGTCGNTEPAQTHDLGIVAARYGLDPAKQLAWQLFGKRRAENRVRQANRELEHGNDS